MSINLAAINGQVSALGIAVTQLISVLPPHQAAQLSLALSLELDTLQQEDADNHPEGTPQEEAQVRDSLLEMMVTLATAISKRG